MIVNDASIDEAKDRIAEALRRIEAEMDEVTVHVEAEINPTESEEKVKAAVTNILGNASISVKPDGKLSILTAEAKGQESLVKLRNILRSDRVRDASRKALFRSIKRQLNQVLLKQAGCVCRTHLFL